MPSLHIVPDILHESPKDHGVFKLQGSRGTQLKRVYIPSTGKYIDGYNGYCRTLVDIDSYRWLLYQLMIMDIDDIR